MTCASRNDAPFIAYCSMLVGMFASICNWVRYEFAFFKIFGTQFNSVDEFNAWKVQQMPNLRHWFTVIEHVILSCFFATAWPLQFPVSDSCELSMTVFKIHVIALFTVYLLAVVFCVCMYVSLRSFHVVYEVYANADAHNVVPPPMETFYFIDEQTECCICLDKTADTWTMTRCAHSFHRACLSNWTQTTATCPVCRTSLDQV